MTTQYLTIIGPPAIALFISGWLRDAKIPKWVDTIIAFLVVLITAWLWALFAGKLVGDLPADTVVIAAYTAALIAGPMAALHQWLTVKWPSPFSAFMSALSPYVPETPATVSPRFAPRSITLPTTSELVQRNSLLSNDPTWRPTVAVAPLPDAAPTLKSTEPITAPVPAVTAPEPTTPDQGQAAPPATP
jgi:hypothetical protein